MPKSITDPTYVGSKAYINYIKLLKKKYREDDAKIRKVQDICKTLIERTTDKDTLQQIIIDYVCQLDRSELNNYDFYHCETCGDYVETYELDI